MRRQERSHLFLHLSAIGMEMCLYSMGLALIADRSGRKLLPFLILLLCYPALFLLNFTAPEGSGRGHRTGILRTLGFAVLIGGAALCLDIHGIGTPGFMRQDLTRLIFPAGLWAFFCLLGISPHPKRIEHRHIQYRFQIAAPILLILASIGTHTVIPAILFTAFSLIALAGARWVDSTVQGIGTIQAVKHRYRVLGPLSILIPAAILLFALSPDLVRTMLRFLAGSGAVLLGWLDRCVAPARAAKPIDILLFSRCTIRAPKEEAAFPKTDLPPGAGMQGEEILFWASAVAVLSIVAAFIFFAVRRSRKKSRPDAGPGVIFESVCVKESLLSRLAAFFAEIRILSGRLLHFIRKLDLTLFRPPGTQQRTLSTVRELYKALLQWAANQGAARLPSQTPLEYLKALCSTFPQKNHELILITEIYIRARYGGLSPNPAEFEEAMRAWTRVRTVSIKHPNHRPGPALSLGDPELR